MKRHDGKPILGRGQLSAIVKEMLPDGRSVEDIAKAAGSTVASVNSCIARLRKLGDLPRARRRARGFILGVEPVPRGLGAAKKPPLPSLTPAGTYDLAELARYLREANAAGMYEAEMAKHLNVPLHRLVYFACNQTTTNLLASKQRTAA